MTTFESRERRVAGNRRIPMLAASLATLCLAKAGIALVAAVSLQPLHIARGPVFVALISEFTTVGLLLMLRGIDDPRAVSLGTFFLLVGSAFADPLLLTAAERGSAWQPAIRLLSAIQATAFLPYFFWQFVSDFPRRFGPYGRQRLARASATAALTVGWVLVAANLVLAFQPSTSAITRFLAFADRGRVDSLYWGILILFVFPVLPYIAWKARQASPDERRRAAVLLAGIGIGIAPFLLMISLEAASSRVLAWDLSPRGRIVTGLLIYPALLSIPVTTSYAVIVHRALNVRLIVRKALRYALARSTLLLATATPFVLLLAAIYARRHESLVDVTTGHQGILLLALTSIGVLAVMFRPRLLDGLDRRFFREQYDAHTILASLVEHTRSTRDLDALAAVIPVEIDRALHLESVSLLLVDPVAGVFATPTGAVRPLARSSVLIDRLEREGEPVEIDWSRGWTDDLPEQDKEWLVEAGARLILLVRGRDDELLGLLTLGEKRSSLPFSREDRMLLHAVTNAVALAVGYAVVPSRPADRDAEIRTPAAECPACGLVTSSHRRTCPRCGAALAISVVPTLVAGKFEPLERIGHGGMGVVYRAMDVTLTREVALKTLPRTAPSGAARMRREARAMAAVAHPNLESIYAVESWQGTPMLIVELLRGGTLADRLARGPLDVPAALELGGTIGGALAALHHAGILHRDIKPSNIGFTGDGTSKLLDFGLAWMLEAAAGTSSSSGHIETTAGGDPLHSLALTGTGDVIGTLPYLAPEALNGGLLTPGGDLWALSLVVYEAIAGLNPFMIGSADQIMERITHVDIPDLRDYRHDAPLAVALFLRDCLSRDRARRPRSALDWTKRIDRLPRAA